MGFKKKVLISLVHGTYGHMDDAYGAIQLANAILARSGEATLFLRGDGAYVLVKGQNPHELGLPNNLDELADFIELGGVIKVQQEDIDERGLRKEDLIEDYDIIGQDDILELLAVHDFCLTF